MLEKNKVAQWMNAQVLNSKSEQFAGIGSDTRKALNGKLFFALRGENFDAHNFLEKALDQGASGIVIDKKDMWEALAAEKANVTVFLVEDTLKALQKLAHHYRMEMGTTILSITGSNGKTTSKEFCAKVLSSFFNTHYNEGSFNNHWGVPFSLMDLKPEHQVAIIEMGMNHAHEIEELVKIAEPNIVVCTMVGNAHIEHFGSQDKIAEAKQEIYQFSSPQATRIFNLDNPWTKKMFEKYGKTHPQTITFSESMDSADVQMKVVEFSINSLTIEGRISGVAQRLEVPVFGEQNLTNIMVAASAALAMKVSPERIWESLKKIKTNWGRNQFVTSDKGGKILFDGYNANPDSVRSLLQNFAKLETRGPKIAVLAEMLELGDKSAEFHKEIGKLVAQSGFDYVFFYGKPFQEFEAGVREINQNLPCYSYASFQTEIIEKLQLLETSASLICVKGSRGMKTERVVQGLSTSFVSK